MEQEIILNKQINHIAFIMDGNGRWAKEHGMIRTLGHKEACNRIIEIFFHCKDYGIKYISMYAFSTENWKRPKSEINHLFKYLEAFFKKEIKTFMNEGIKVIISGDISKLPERTMNTCIDAMERTKNNPNYVMNFCLNYGSQQEILRATALISQDVKDGKLDINDINEEVFESKLYTSIMPPVDLMVRTSGEQRLSNYLLWQNAYAEFVFTPVKWPDFKREAFVDCLKEFNNRNRRFGGLDK